MRAYVGCVDHFGLQRFFPEDVLPRDLLRELVPEWTSPTASVIWAVIAQDDAAAIRRELVADRRDSACNMLLNRAVEILATVPGLVEDGADGGIERSRLGPSDRRHDARPEAHRFGSV